MANRTYTYEIAYMDERGRPQVGRIAITPSNDPQAPRRTELRTEAVRQFVQALATGGLEIVGVHLVEEALIPIAFVPAEELERLACQEFIALRGRLAGTAGTAGTRRGPGSSSQAPGGTGNPCNGAWACVDLCLGCAPAEWGQTGLAGLDEVEHSVG